MRYLILGVIFICNGALSGTVVLDWKHNYLDIEGNLIPRSNLEFKVHASIDDVEYEVFDSTQELQAVYFNVPDGCYYVYITAIRTDYNLESDPSETAYICVVGDQVYRPTPPEWKDD